MNEYDVFTHMEATRLELAWRADQVRLHKVIAGEMRAAERSASRLARLLALVARASRDARTAVLALQSRPPKRATRLAPAGLGYEPSGNVDGGAQETPYPEQRWSSDERPAQSLQAGSAPRELRATQWGGDSGTVCRGAGEQLHAAIAPGDLQAQMDDLPAGGRAGVVVVIDAADHDLAATIFRKQDIRRLQV